ncbi:MAG TPA: TadE/TadG family type IV pilus assembly protein [Chloroflexota bacterium]|nr:TadE/TadG family type IV pilus assembly protein [Chloroflexota bacterium]
MRYGSKLGAARRGQSMVEMAIALWVFLFIGFGLVEGALWAWHNGTLQHAVEEGARYALRSKQEDGVTPMDEATVKAAVIATGYGLGLTAPDVTVVVCPDGTACDPLCASGPAYATRVMGDRIRVCAQYTHTMLLGSLVFGQSSVVIPRQAQIRVESTP